MTLSFCSGWTFQGGSTWLASLRSHVPSWPPAEGFGGRSFLGLYWLAQCKMSTWVHHPKTGSSEEEINLQMQSGCCDGGVYHEHGLPTVPSSCPLFLLYYSDSLSCDSTLWFNNVRVYIIGLIWSLQWPWGIDKQERGWFPYFYQCRNSEVGHLCSINLVSSTHWCWAHRFGWVGHVVCG